MSEPTRKRGRRPGQGAKAPGEKWEKWSLVLPPDLLAEFRKWVPAGKRGEFVRAALQAALREFKKPADRGPGPDACSTCGGRGTEYGGLCRPCYDKQRLGRRK